jgi:formylmethanofuran dehydrogenase subunit C
LLFNILLPKIDIKIKLNPRRIIVDGSVPVVISTFSVGARIIVDGSVPVVISTFSVGARIIVDGSVPVVISTFSVGTRIIVDGSVPVVIPKFSAEAGMNEREKPHNNNAATFVSPFI